MATRSYTRTRTRNRARRDPWFSSTERVVESDFITPNRIVLLIFIFITAAVALFYLWTTWQAVHWLNERQQAEIQLQELEHERERLRFETEQAFSLKRVEEIARGPLGMRMPTLNDGTLHYLYLLSE